jgi:tetratricopeptide (TPR) repeat protein
MKMLERCLIALTALVVLVSAVPATAQIPDEFTNLKVLPEDIGKRDLMNIMRAFSGALGKRCHYCHVGEPGADLSTYDFASDEKEHKRIARIMMTMTNDINNTHMPKLEKESAIRVRCVTCHHGVNEPETIDNIVMATAGKDGVDAAMTEYRELRERYYGSASYDFGSGPLNTLAERLAGESQDLDGAIAVMQMNLEFNPDESYPYLLLGQLYMQAGDKEAAVASVEKALELEPDNAWAQKMLERMKASE